MIINSRFLSQPITGVQRFAIEISRCLKKIDPTIRFVAPRNIIHHDLAEELKAETCGNLTGHFWEQLELPLYLRRQGGVLLLNLANTAPLFYANKLVTVYDLAFHHHPEWFSKKFAIVYNFLIPRIVKQSHHIFTDSNFVLEDIVRTYAVDRRRVTCIYGDAAGVFKECHLAGVVKEDFVLAVGSIDPRKNLHGLISAYLTLDLKSKLVIVGSENKVFSDIKLKELIKSTEKIEFTGYLSDEALRDLYRSAKIFVYPSFFEGFGIPPLEAQACGCPVIVSNSTSLPEVCEGSVIYCDPKSTEDIAEKMSLLLGDTRLQRVLREKGFQNVKRFSWERSAQQIMQKAKELR